jgi:hypothetical protein
MITWAFGSTESLMACVTDSTWLYSFRHSDHIKLHQTFWRFADEHPISLIHFRHAMLIKPQPTLNIKPSGKLAHCRQPQAGTATVVAGAAPPSPTPVSCKAIPMPLSNNHMRKHNVSCSDPALSHMPSTTQAFFHGWFQVWYFSYMQQHDGCWRCIWSTPTTLPLSVAFPRFLPAPASTPQNKTCQGGRKHKQSPSEGMFTMSSDEDSSGLDPNVMALFQRARTTGSISLDRATLADEAEPAISFLDDCIQQG